MGEVSHDDAVRALCTTTSTSSTPYLCFNSLETLPLCHPPPPNSPMCGPSDPTQAPSVATGPPRTSAK